MRPRIVLADDHVMVAEGLGRLIAEIADLIERVSDGEQLVERVRRLKPDLVVTDITMPLMSGLDAMRTLKADGSKSKFIFLTVHAEPRLAAEAMRSGASAFVLKQAAGEELIEAIRCVMAGRTYVTPDLAGEVLRILARPADAGNPALTSRQREVLVLIAQGKRLKEIAADLNISVRTVEDHKAQLLQALDLKSTADLVKFAIKQNLIAN